MDLDGAGLAVGTYADSIDVVAPSADDGGAALPVSLSVHDERRAGPEIVVHGAYDPRGSGRQPAVAADGNGVLAAWEEQPGSPTQVTAAYIDDSGNVTGPFVVWASVSGFFGTIIDGEDVAVASDGNNFLVVWIDQRREWVSETSFKTKEYTTVKAVRVTAAGVVLDPEPIVLQQDVENENSYGSFDFSFAELAVDFDDTAYTVIWRKLDYGSAQTPSRVFMSRVSTAGSLLSPAAQIYPTATTQLYQTIWPRLACRSGICLVAWAHFDGETSPTGKYIYKAHGQRYAGAQALDAQPYLLMTDMNNLEAVAAGDNEWMIVGFRYVRPKPDSDGYELVAARVAANGTPLDPNGIRFDNGPAEGLQSLWRPTTVIYDGTQYIVSWNVYGPRHLDFHAYPLASRIQPDGTVLETEDFGSLLLPTAEVTYTGTTLAPTATKSMLFWYEPYDFATTTPGRILAQGVFER
jgi:hypothetical protein